MRQRFRTGESFSKKETGVKTVNSPQFSLEVQCSRKLDTRLVVYLQFRFACNKVVVENQFTQVWGQISKIFTGKSRKLTIIKNLRATFKIYHLKLKSKKNTAGL